MRRISLLIIVCWLLATQLPAAPGPIAFLENEIQATIKADGISLKFAADNPSGQHVQGKLKVELFSPDDTVKSTSVVDADLQTGTSRFSTDLPFRVDRLPVPESKNIYWYRVRVTLVDNNGKSILAKTWSLSEISPEVFNVRVAADYQVSFGEPFIIRVVAEHFLKKTPIGGVQIRAALLNDEAEVATASVVTDNRGWATISLDNIPFINIENLTLKIEAVKNGIHDEYQKSVSARNEAQIIVSNDKPIYQPGQTYHARILAFTASQSKPLPSAKGEVEIADVENSKLYKTAFTTNEFGVASIEWKIPEDLRLGDYLINTTLENGGQGYSALKLSRYELPTFEVKTDSDQKFYMVGQNAKITVTGTYLFGKPVPRGHLRIVRESDRNWNYREQKWDITEDAVYQGTADDQGRFTTTVKLDNVLDTEDKDARKSWESRYSEFRDVNFAAYFTDASTNRTEQARFDLRVTREPIHIYAYRSMQALGLPLDFFISTTTADGKPIPAEVTISDQSGKISANIRTNHFGLGKYASTEALTDSSNIKLRMSAKDNTGRTGMIVEDLYVGNLPGVRVKLDRVLYAKEQPIHVKLQTSLENTFEMVDIVSEGRIQKAMTVPIRNHVAEFTVPYESSFEGMVEIAAFAPNTESYCVVGQAIALYPKEHELSLNVKFSKSEYKPGESVVADLQSSDGNGGPILAALGLNVIDRALEVRADSDSSFGGISPYFAGSRNPYFQEMFAVNDGDEVTFHSLLKYDPSKPLPADIQLSAEMLSRGDQYAYGHSPYFDSGERAEVGLNRLFIPLFEGHLKEDNQTFAPAFEDFHRRYDRYPANQAEVSFAFKNAGLDPNYVRDPWGNPYQVWTGIEGPMEGSRLISAGPDQKPGTDDDIILATNFTPYFAKTSALITEIVNNYHFKTNKFILDDKTLRKTLNQQGLDASSLRDKWGTPYRLKFINDDRYVTIQIISNGPDRKTDNTDDFTISSVRQDYLAEIESSVSNAIYDHFNRTNTFPKSIEEFLQAEREANIDFRALKDPVGGAFYVTVKTEERFDDLTQIEANNSGQDQKVKVEPVKRKFQIITVRSTGRDHKEGTLDDFTVAVIDQLIAEQHLTESNVRIVEDEFSTADFKGRISHSLGAIKGTLYDPNRAVIAGAVIEAVNVQTEVIRKVISNSDGTFLLYSLRPGVYKVRVSAPGFKSAILEQIFVSTGGVVRVDVTLEVGQAMETISVSASKEVLNTSTATVTSTRQSRADTGPANHAAPTPRIRQYFPENLLWQPMLVTDEKGAARVEFKLADTITTWKMGVIGSTKDGRIAAAQAEIKSFQPFFIEPDPPTVLTEGDEISLPVVVRNYTDKKQDVKLSLTPAAWFTLQDKTEKNVSTPSGDSVTEHFRLKAIASGEQKETITGIGNSDSDAVEKTTTVHPDGEEVSQTVGDLLTENSKLEVNVPDYALTSGRQLKLKLYPNLFSQGLEGIEGIVQRPGGCAEQTISSTYPNLIVLQYLKKTDKPLPKVQETAQRNLQLGYDRLTNFITADGGVGYFIGYKSDFALTAYALRFLADASEFISIDDSIQKKMQDWLLARQDADGRWITDSARFHRIYEDGAPRETAYVCSVLARSLKKDDPKLTKGLDYIEKAIAIFPDPYVISLYTMAQMDAGNQDKAIAAAKQLEQGALTEGSMRYWNLEVNTPFYGWGRAGRVETTAMALEAIVRAHRLPEWQQRSTDNLINRALLFLIKEKDRYGVWYSSQATVRVLHSLIVLSDEQIATPSTDLSIRINGHSVKPVTLPSGNELSNFITVDLTDNVRPGPNTIELHRSASGQSVAVQIVESHYIPWSKAEKIGRANNLRLAVKVNKEAAAVGETITYSVEAERMAFRGYGMMLAEIGLPPGCDVDRASLEKTVKDSGWALWRYGVLPDRVVFYIWPHAETTKISFDVKPRFPIHAKLAASVLYDYYNPEARVSAVPQIVTVH